MSEIWKRVGNTECEVSDAGRFRRGGVEMVPYVNSRGYRCVGVGGKMVQLHRLIAAAFLPNPFGKPFVDHIDGDPLNNAVSNLRWATRAENCRNCKPRIKKSDLPRGVKKHGSKYKAQINYEGKKYYLGIYDTPAEASEIYEVTAQEVFGEFYRPL